MASVPSLCFWNTYFKSQELKRKVFLVRARRIASTPKGQRIMNSTEMRTYIRDRARRLRQGVELRQQQERDTTKGERVWFSRHILNGRLQHWVLIMHGNKYELRRADHVESEPGSRSKKRKQDQVNSEPGRHSKRRKQERYVCNIQKYTIDQEWRDASLAEVMIPEVDGYYVCLIGWTKHTKAEVDTIARDVREKFGEYSLRNNCQKFLRKLAKRILTDKAADYPWFASNTKTRYQKDQWLKPPPAEMMTQMLAKMEEAERLNERRARQAEKRRTMRTELREQIVNQRRLKRDEKLVELYRESRSSGREFDYYDDESVGGDMDMEDRGYEDRGYEGYDQSHEGHRDGDSRGGNSRVDLFSAAVIAFDVFTEVVSDVSVSTFDFVSTVVVNTLDIVSDVVVSVSDVVVDIVSDVVDDGGGYGDGGGYDDDGGDD